MQHESFQGTECWLEKVVLECLQNLLVHMRKTLHMTGTTMPAKARQYNKLKHCGMIFSPTYFSVQDSHIIGKGFSGDWHVGKIKQIFIYPFDLPESQEAYVVVMQMFKELLSQEAMQDPYHRYSMIGGRLYHSKLEEQIELVTVHNVIAHFAYTPYDGLDFRFSYFHALPLNKVLFSQYQLSNTNFSFSNSEQSDRFICAKVKQA